MPRDALTEAIGRVNLMAQEGQDKWDLSPNDQRDLRLVLNRLEDLERDSTQCRAAMRDADHELRAISPADTNQRAMTMIQNSINGLRKGVQ